MKRERGPNIRMLRKAQIPNIRTRRAQRASQIPAEDELNAKDGSFLKIDDFNGYAYACINEAEAVNKTTCIVFCPTKIFELSQS